MEITVKNHSFLPIKLKWKRYSVFKELILATDEFSHFMYLYSTSQGFFVRCFKFRITPELNQQLLIVSEADFYSISGRYKYSLALKMS